MTDNLANSAFSKPSPSSDTNLLAYNGSVGQIYKVWFKNLFFMIITLTIYRAWAKARMRKYLWAHTKVDGDPLHYTGTGGELFRGFLKVALLFFVLSLASALVVAFVIDEDVSTTQEQTAEQQQADAYIALEKCGYTNENWHELTNEIYYGCIEKYGTKTEMATSPAVAEIANLILLPFILYVVFFTRYSALRYRLSRTTWRGIRGSMRGSANRYAMLAFGRMFLNLLSLGTLIPKSDMIKQEYITRDMYIGNQKAEFNNDTSGLMKTHIITSLLAIPTLTLSRLWYSAALKNKKLANTTFGGVTLKGTYTGGKLASLYFVNTLILLITFGLGMPLIINRTIGFHTTNTIISGRIDSTNILQAKSDAGNMGEGFDDAIDTGLDIDFGFI